jgi:hypothetical protein
MGHLQALWQWKPIPATRCCGLYLLGSASGRRISNGLGDEVIRLFESLSGSLTTA